MNINVNVTQEDIDNGVAQCESGCPIALSLKRFLTKLIDIRVGLNYLELELKTDENIFKKYHAKLPISTFDFILNFDRGEKVAPISFEITLIPKI